ncbi:terminase large subunit domain-containing protein, partial [Yersinia enterocolitica]
VYGAAAILINLEEIREENSASAFNQLYMCQFVDTGDCVFRFDQLEQCLTSVSTWEDHDVNAMRPFGNREVWAGYDPARTGDTASFVLVAPPQVDG